MSPQMKRLLARCVIQQRYVGLKEALPLWWWLWMWWRWSDKNGRSPSQQISSRTQSLPPRPSALACWSCNVFLWVYTAVLLCLRNKYWIASAALLSWHDASLVSMGQFVAVHGCYGCYGCYGLYDLMNYFQAGFHWPSWKGPLRLPTVWNNWIYQFIKDKI